MSYVPFLSFGCKGSWCWTIHCPCPTAESDIGADKSPPLHPLQFTHILLYSLQNYTSQSVPTQLHLTTSKQQPHTNPEWAVTGDDSPGGEFLKLLRQKVLSGTPNVTVTKILLMENNCNRQPCAKWLLLKASLHLCDSGWPLESLCALLLIFAAPLGEQFRDLSLTLHAKVSGLRHPRHHSQRTVQAYFFPCLFLYILVIKYLAAAKLLIEIVQWLGPSLHFTPTSHRSSRPEMDIYSILSESNLLFLWMARIHFFLLN